MGVRRWANQRGQLVIPALFVIPSLVLFIYLIFETAKLSAEKIKHQFALDTAVFVEMANYSDFLNRTAYVNGPFPARVCYEAFSDPELTLQVDEDYGSSSQPMGLYDYLKLKGLCPYSTKCADPSSCAELAQQGASDWGFTYNEEKCDGYRNCTEGRNSDNPDVTGKRLVLFDRGFVTSHHVYDAMVQFLIQNYNIIFSLLGIVETSQIAVFHRLTDQGGHYFFNRAYVMNAPGERATAMSQLPKLDANPMFLGQVTSYVKIVQQGSGGNDVTKYPDFPMAQALVLTTVTGLDGNQNIAPREIKQTWKVDPNYFRVDGNSVLGAQPFVHATVEVSGGRVWRGATPRYQVRIYP